jgi:hypothetical protein
MQNIFSKTTILTTSLFFVFLVLLSFQPAIAGGLSDLQNDISSKSIDGCKTVCKDGVCTTVCPTLPEVPKDCVKVCDEKGICKIVCPAPEKKANGQDCKVVCDTDGNCKTVCTPTSQMDENGKKPVGKPVRDNKENCETVCDANGNCKTVCATGQNSSPSCSGPNCPTDSSSNSASGGGFFQKLFAGVKSFLGSITSLF